MPLILAIEPDRKQAAKIAALAKNPLHAELVISDSAEAALATLAHRMPDLILTSLLLSPKDDAVLTDRLRELDAAGAHVPTLVIPVLGSASRRSSVASGLLTRLRKAKVDDSSLEGCDPAMFAAQITEYLERAALEREAHADRLEARSYREGAPVPVAVPPDLAEFYAPPEPETLPAAAPVIDEQPEPQQDFYEPMPQVETPLAAAPAEPEPTEWTRTEPEWRAEPQLVQVPQEPAEDVEPHIEVSTSVEDDEPAAPPQLHVWEPDGDASRPRLIRVPDEDLIEEFTFDSKPAATSRPSLQPGDSPQKVVRNTLMAELIDRDPLARELEVVEDPDTSAALAVESATWEKFEQPVPPPIFERVATRSVKGGAGHARSSVKRVRVENETTAVDEMRWTVTTEMSADPELADFVTALETLKPRKGDKLPEPATARRPIAPDPEPAKVSGRSKKRDDAPPAVPMGPQAAWPRLETTATDVPATPAVAPELPAKVDEKSAIGDTADKGRKGRPKKKRDAQDEWGMFDPEQCGISAVMAKLDEIKDTD